jgi:ubiquinone biosynthesis protein COQ9
MIPRLLVKTFLHIRNQRRMYPLKALPDLFICRYSQTTSSASASDQEIEKAILDAALSHVHTVGWTQEAIALGAKDLSLSPITASVIEHPVLLVHHFLTDKRIHVKKYMQEQRLSTKTSSDSQPVDHPLYMSISKHIEIIKPYLNTWPSAIALLIDPRHLPISASILFHTIEDFCEYADIHAAKLDWYSERGLLLIVYSITELYMIADDSQDLQDTKDFLKRLLTRYESMRQSPSTVAMIRETMQSMMFEFMTAKK